MTDQQDRARAFHALHIPGDPVILYNIWDPGSARAVAKAGARALATGSASVAASRGYGDREGVPIEEVLTNAARIVASVDVPVTLDFEGGYAVAPDEAAANVARVRDAGIVGINFEDQILAGEGMHPIDLQAERIAAIRAAVGADFFINARTDVWLKAGQAAIAAQARLGEAMARMTAYADAGASGFFVPGLADEAEIAAICEASPIPVNAMMTSGMPSHARLAELGVARISHAAGPWREAMARLTEAARALYA